MIQKTKTGLHTNIHINIVLSTVMSELLTKEFTRDFIEGWIKHLPFHVGEESATVERFLVGLSEQRLVLDGMFIEDSVCDYLLTYLEEVLETEIGDEDEISGIEATAGDRWDSMTEKEREALVAEADNIQELLGEALDTAAQQLLRQSNC